MKKKNKVYMPNYQHECVQCGNRPTVDVYVDGAKQYDTYLCGACTFADSAMINPRRWKEHE